MRRGTSGTGVSPVFSGHYVPPLFSTGETPVPLASRNRASPFSARDFVPILNHRFSIRTNASVCSRIARSVGSRSIELAP